MVQPGETLQSLAATHLKDPSKDWIISEFNDITAVSPGQKLIIPLSEPEKGGLTAKGYQTVPVIAYQKLTTNRLDKGAVLKESLEDQMKFLKENSFNVITIDQFAAFLDFKIRLPKKSVLITFEDDWKNVYDIAYPILKKYGYPAVLFIDVDDIADSNAPPSWDILSEMSKSGISIECQSKSIAKMGKLDKKELSRSLFDTVNESISSSKLVMRNELKKELRYLAYPLSEPNILVSEIVRRHDFQGAFAVKQEGNPFFVQRDRINRSVIAGNFTLSMFERSLSLFRREVLEWK
ncbi:MAG: polysaccharide deacetylase family protein [Nitrospirae bacterium]|nr:polysaccharide deacetylase family protein [Nitrospirota bacterium]